MSFDKITFFGLGLIGGSIAKAIRERYPDTVIYAHARHEDTIVSAFRDDVINNDHLLSMKELAEADLIFLCAPVGTNISYMKELKGLIKSDTILTDVGSVKGDIHKAADELGLSGQFIGGHPMTGSEKIGYDHSSPLLLENAYYILTCPDTGVSSISEASSTGTQLPESSTDDRMSIAERRLPELKDYIESLGPAMITLSPDIHDFATGAISHLPHVISAALVNLVSDNETEDDLLKTIAAGGFRDITRISSSSPEMWEHICTANRDQVLRLLSLYKESLDKFEYSIKADDKSDLRSLFSSAKDYRDSLSVKKRGALSSSYSFYCDMFDEAGQIAAVATILASNAISIKNIGIVHNREFEEGVLQVEFYDMKSMESAMELLTKHHYTVHPRR